MTVPENHLPRQRTAYLFSLGISILSLFFIGVFGLTMASGYAQWQAWVILAGLALLLGNSLLSARLSRQGRHEEGITSLLGTIFLVEVVSSILVQSVGTALGIGIVAATLTIATGTLSQQRTTRLFLASLFMGLIATGTSLLPLPWRLVLPDARIFVLGFSVLSVLVFIVTTIWKFHTYPLPGKLLVALVGLVMTAAIGQTLFTLNSLGKVLTSNARQTLLASAQQGAAEIDRYLSSNLATVEVSAQLPILADYLQLPKEERITSDLNTEVNQFMRNLRTFDLTNISGYLLLDSDGRVVKDTTGYMYPYSAQVSYAQRDFYQQPFTTGKSYISPPQFTIKPNPATPYFYMGAPIRVPLSNKIVGVLVARFRADALQEMIAEQGGRQGPLSFAALYAPLEDNLVHLAHGTHPELALALVGPEQTTRLVSLQNRGYLSLPYMETLTLEDADLLKALTEDPDEHFFNVSHTYALPEGEPITSSTATFQGASVSLRSAPWILAYYEPRGAILAGLRSQLLNNQLVALGITIAATLLAVFLAQAIAHPLSRLERAAQDLADGNLDVRAPESSEDEIGRLAAAFNAMAEKLKNTLNEMEERIARRTAEAERRSTMVKTAAEVGHIASQIHEPERLLPQAAQLISERFGFYHVGIFLLDARGEYAVLQASNSLGGQRMLERKHRLKVEASSIVGYAIAQHKARIALDVGEDAVYFDNPDLPSTRSEMAIPLIAGGEVLGALDVQSTRPHAFSEEDFEVMQLLADQIAIAIANARLFARNQQALEDIRRAYGEVTSQAWNNLLNASRDISFASLGTDVLPIEAVWDTPSQQVMASGRPLAASQPDDKGRYRLTLPIRSGDVSLGVISAYKDDMPWSEIEITLLENILRELGLTLESSRLFEEGRRRAQLERARAQVITRLRETLDIQAMLRVAAQEIREALDLPEVSVRVAPPAPDGDSAPAAE